jgi:hypothetical protein
VPKDFTENSKSGHDFLTARFLPFIADRQECLSYSVPTDKMDRQECLSYCAASARSHSSINPLKRDCDSS